jgi:hypothetical protein
VKRFTAKRGKSRCFDEQIYCIATEEMTYQDIVGSGNVIDWRAAPSGDGNARPRYHRSTSPPPTGAGLAMRAKSSHAISSIESIVRQLGILRSAMPSYRLSAWLSPPPGSPWLK